MGIEQIIGNLNEELRKQVPLVHNITNYVTVNDCANALLAIGGSPIMADDINEVEEITSISSAIVINIGTLNKRTIESMIKAGQKANELNIPVIFDPVGAGASTLRNDTTKEILEKVKVSIIRGNLSEISFIAGLEVATKGVDSAEEDNKNDSSKVAKEVARKFNCTVAITGVVDTISDGERVVKLSNGTKLLSKVTGTGCMTSAITGAYAGVCKGDYFSATIGGVISMGIAGEIAYERASEVGTGSFHIAVIDALSKLDKNIIEKMAKIDEE